MPDQRLMWDQRYAEPDYVYGTEPNAFLAEAVGALKGGACLCLAEGQGRNAVWLAGQGFAVTAMDTSAVGLERARALAAQKGVVIHTEQADLADYDLGQERWDSIVAIFAHLPPALRASVHRRIVAALKPGGTVLLEAYTPEKFDLPGTGGPPAGQADTLMTRAMLLEDFAGLVPEVAREVHREVNEGSYHHGLSATVQFIGRKPGE